MPDSDSHLSYLTHKNGRGRLYDTSEACERSYVDRDSRLSDQTAVWHSKIVHSSISASVISESIIKNSWVTASDIHGAIVEDSTISCEFLGGNVHVRNSTILEKSRVVHNAVCDGVRFRNLTVKGDAVLRDWNQPEGEILEGSHGYVARGTWTRPPRIFRVSPAITLTEGVPGFVFIHCREFEIHHLLKIGRRIGRQSNWTPDEVLAVRRILHHLSR